LPDPHSYGSGNPGATNVLRTGNKAAAVIALIGDGGKGWLAVFLAQLLSASIDVADWTVPAVALAVFVGHLYPVFHHFAGGKEAMLTIEGKSERLLMADPGGRIIVTREMANEHPGAVLVFSRAPEFVVPYSDEKK
jgi:acyl-phosphate glycerol 3-phosphate acyltransferase